MTILLTDQAHHQPSTNSSHQNEFTMTNQGLLPELTRNDVAVKVATNGMDRIACYEIRNKIFVKEQKFPYEWEVDGKDDTAIHILAYDSCVGRPMGTVRLLLDHNNKIKDNYSSGSLVATITRVSVMKEFRSLGVGRKLMEFCVEHMKSIRVNKAVMGAQTHATGFYESLGFHVKEGCEEYNMSETNIPHVNMEQEFVY